MKYKCVVKFREPFEVELEAEDYTEAAVDAIIKTTEEIKSTPFKKLAKSLDVVCFKMD